MAAYIANKSRSRDRTGWAVIFRHPAVVNTDTGKPGKRLRYGLGTRDEEIADRMTADLNLLLADKRWWSLAARPAATERFDQRVVQIFYAPMVPDHSDMRGVRDELLPLPTRDDGYRTVLLVGTTGAGKTTVLRQIIGTDPTEERFPTTATGRTTIADTEFVLADGDFSAVVTFFSLDEVTEHLADCVLQSVVAAFRGEPRAEVRRALLRHRDDRFRFNYVLGDGGSEPSTVMPASLLSATSFGSLSAAPDVGMPELGTLDLDETNALIEQLVDRCIVFATETVASIQAELGPQSDEDQRAVAELVEEEIDSRLRDDDDVHLLVDALVDEIRKRFDLIGDIGEIRKNTQGWPVHWSWSTPDRTAFIRNLRRFTSNAKLGFGRLLTPIVQGVRVRGPFRPTWHNGPPPELIVIDTEGLGHTLDSAASLPSKFTRMITEADAVALVDNAQQPMQAAPATLLRAMARSGHGAKLHTCFTHFDAVTGDNLPTPQDQALHTLNSTDGLLARIGRDLGVFAERPLRARFREASYFLADCHRRLDPERDALTIGEFQRLLASLQRSGDRPTLAETRPIYDRTNLVVAVRDAVEEFHDRWNAILGRPSSAIVETAHWATVKALSRRLAVMNEDGYRKLQPVADLHAWLQDQVWVMIQAPVSWTAGEPSEDERQALFDEFANRLSKRMLELAHDRLQVQRNHEWIAAFTQSGRGSTFGRARIIADRIYAEAAPVPQATPAPKQNEFLHQVIHLVRSIAADLGISLE